MKPIIYRGGIAKFCLPSDWIEHYETAGGGTFFANKPDAGTLRINVIDLDKPADDPTNTAYDFLSAIGETSSIGQLSNGAAITRSEQRHIDKEEKLLLYTWQVSVCVTPTHFRLIIFTYTILAKQEFNQNTQQDIAMLEQSISEGEYPAIRGVSGNC